MVICSPNQLITWLFCSVLALTAWNALFWLRKCSLVSKRAYLYQNQPFLIIFFTKNTYFAMNSHFLVQESLCWSHKGLFLPKKAFLGCFGAFFLLKHLRLSKQKSEIYKTGSEEIILKQLDPKQAVESGFKPKKCCFSQFFERLYASSPKWLIGFEFWKKNLKI